MWPTDQLWILRQWMLKVTVPMGLRTLLMQLLPVDLLKWKRLQPTSDNRAPGLIRWHPHGALEAQSSRETSPRGQIQVRGPVLSSLCWSVVLFTWGSFNEHYWESAKSQAVCWWSPNEERAWFLSQKAQVKFQDRGCKPKCLQGPSGESRWGMRARSGQQQEVGIDTRRTAHASPKGALLPSPPHHCSVGRGMPFSWETRNLDLHAKYAKTHRYTYTRRHKSETAPSALFQSLVCTGPFF